MKASIVDLRYRMKDVLRALKRNEEVQILYHGKTAGRIIPSAPKVPFPRVEDHPLFGISREGHGKRSVQKVMDHLRGGRYRAL